MNLFVTVNTRWNEVILHSYKPMNDHSRTKLRFTEENNFHQEITLGYTVILWNIIIKILPFHPWSLRRLNDQEDLWNPEKENI